MPMEGKITARMKNGKLTIDVEPDSVGHVSSSGKSDVIATTGGFMNIDGAEPGTQLSLTVIRKKAK